MMWYKEKLDTQKECLTIEPSDEQRDHGNNWEKRARTYYGFLGFFFFFPLVLVSFQLCGRTQRTKMILAKEK